MAITIHDLAAYQDALEVATFVDRKDFYRWWWEWPSRYDGRLRLSVMKVLRERDPIKAFFNASEAYDRLNELSREGR